MSEVIRPRLPHEPKHVLNGEPQVVFQARIGAIVNFPILEDQGQGYVQRTFEKYSRPPGIRIIAMKDKKIYLQKEFRYEGEGFDWRLPGGKFFNTFEEYKPYVGKALPESVVFDAAARELKEEAHLEPTVWRLWKRDICGTTVEWDLYYVIGEGFNNVADAGNLAGAHGEGEDIRDSEWFPFEEVKKMCEKGQITEGRTVAALIQLLASENFSD